MLCCYNSIPHLWKGRYYIIQLFSITFYFGNERIQNYIFLRIIFTFKFILPSKFTFTILFCTDRMLLLMSMRFVLIYLYICILNLLFSLFSIVELILITGWWRRSHTSLVLVDINNEPVNVCMFENWNTCLHPSLKWKINHVVIISFTLCSVCPSAAHFYNLVNDRRTLVTHYTVQLCC